MLNEGIARRGLCLVVAAPSGAGKSTITRRLLAEDPGLHLSVSVTTRAPRPGEQEGVHYYFRDRAAFDEMVAQGALLEHAIVFGRGYGTPAAPVLEALRAGRDVLFDIDWQGFLQLRDRMREDVVSVFLLPPSLQVLEGRLHARSTDDPAEISKRMEASRTELSHWPDFDHVVLNDDLETALAGVRAVLHAGRLQRQRQYGLADFVARLMA
jgi:guanylate kinase